MNQTQSLDWANQETSTNALMCPFLSFFAGCEELEDDVSFFFFFFFSWFPCLIQRKWDGQCTKWRKQCAWMFVATTSGTFTSGIILTLLLPFSHQASNHGTTDPLHGAWTSPFICLLRRSTSSSNFLICFASFLAFLASFFAFLASKPCSLVLANRKQVCVKR